MVIYINETNVNLFLRRTQCRSRKGTRFCVKVPTSRGQNIHIIAGISQAGLVYWERRRGAYKKEHCHEWWSSVEPMANTIVVCDNVPCHSTLEQVMEEEEFEGARLLRLGPYSAPLNQIEEEWTVLKEHRKSALAQKMTELLTTAHPAGTALVAHRLQFLERNIDSNIHHVSLGLCLKIVIHVQKNFPACLISEDWPENERHTCCIFFNCLSLPQRLTNF